MKKIKKTLRLNTLVSILLMLSITVFYAGCSNGEGIDEVVDEVVDEVIDSSATKHRTDFKLATISRTNSL
jgi:hypothetical protein